MDGANDNIPTSCDPRLTGSELLKNKPKQVAAAPGQAPISMIKEWLIDTGCGYDLVDRRDVAPLKDAIEHRSDDHLRYARGRGHHG